MEIIDIYPPYLYAVKYSGDNLNIYRLTIKNLTDDEYLENFFNTFKDKIGDYLITTTGYSRDEIEEYEAETNDQMIDISEELKQICNDLRSGKLSDFQGYFKPHSKYDFSIPPDGGGNSQAYGVSYLPVKCYGSGRPSLVRLYAIELSYDCYLIIFGGIKITKTTEDCPAFDSEESVTTLETEIRRRLHMVCNFLKENNIVDRQGLLDYMEEDHE